MDSQAETAGPRECPTCGAAMTERTVTREIAIAGVPFDVTAEALVCEKGHWELTPATLRRVFSFALRRIVGHGPATPETFRYLRGQLGAGGDAMSYADLASALGVSADDIARWETGAAPLPPAMWMAAAMMVRNRLDGEAALAQLDEGAPAPPIAIDVRGAA